MAEETNISWCDRTWSPWYGCTQVSLGEHGACEGCYARFISETRQQRVVFGGPGRGIGTRDAKAESGWKEPLKWEREAAALRRAWFAGPEGGMGRPWPYSPLVFPSMCDPFDNHPALTDLRRRFFDLIRATPNLTWLLLTKRPSNVLKLFADTLPPTADKRDAALRAAWPRNAAIGCTVVTQAEADRDIPHLLAAKAALNPAFAFVSMEPLLGPVDLSFRPSGAKALPVQWEDDKGEIPLFDGHRQVQIGSRPRRGWSGFSNDGRWIDWVIAGGETDQGAHKARPSHPDWFRSLRDQCAAAGVPFHFKQWGEHLPEAQVDASGLQWAPGQDGGVHWWTPEPLEGEPLGDGACSIRVGKKAAGRLLDGVLHDARPEDRPC